MRSSRTARVIQAVAAVAMMAVVVAVLSPREDNMDETGKPSPDLLMARAEAALRSCPRPAPGTSGGSVLADVHATCLADGESVDLGAALADRPVLLTVWSPRCDGCRRELSVLDDYAKSAGAVDVIGVLARGDAVDGLRLLAGESVRLPTVHDTTGELSVALDVPDALPVTYLLDPDGTVHRLVSPEPLTSATQLQTTVDRHLAGHPWPQHTQRSNAHD